MSESAPFFGLAHWTSLLPAVLAILMALTLKQVLISLFAGIWVGAYLLSSVDGGAVVTSFLATLTAFIVPAVADRDNATILIFSLLVGGMVGIITDNGGTRGVVEGLTRLVRTKVQGQIASASLALAVFFDDYATTMVVGNTMRPLTDRLRISRAKLAYFVDSMAAPVATLALVSTWVGALVAFIATSTAGLEGLDVAPYSLFLNSLPYNFYGFFTIIFVFVLALSGRDFGPMLRSRLRLYRARHDPDLDTYDVWSESAVEAEEPVSAHWTSAAIPILVLVVGTIAGLFVTGEGDSLQDIIAAADSFVALLWGSLLGLVVAMIMTVAQRLLTMDAMMDSMLRGMFIMFGGLVILVLAWGLSAVTQQLGAAEFLVGLFGEAIGPLWIPSLALGLAAAISFATGSSWGTIGILLPLAVPLVWSLGLEMDLGSDALHTLVYSSIGAVFAGAVFGDHTSPLSDTTILSSIAAQCDHVEHVNTQLAYAGVCLAIAFAAQLVVSFTGVPWWVVYVAGSAVMVAIIYVFGSDPSPDSSISARRTAPR